MLNQIVLVGRLQEIKEEEKGVSITLIVPKSYKNEEGIYEEDYIPVRLFGNVAKNTIEWCNKGDLVGIKGRIQAKDNDIEIVAEKLTFLSSKKEDENND